MNHTPPDLSGGSKIDGLALCMIKAFENADLKSFAAELMDRSREPNPDPGAMMDLSIVLQLSGEEALGLSIQAMALDLQRLYTVNSPPEGAIKALALMAPGNLMSNTPYEFLCRGDLIQTQALYIKADEPFPSEVPDHDVLICAVGESDENQALLRLLADVKPVWPRPWINDPSRIAALSREQNSHRLAGIPGALTPLSKRATRSELEGLCNGARALAPLLADGRFPLIIRPSGSHAGKGLERVGSTLEMEAYMAQSDSSDFVISNFIDYRDTSGLYKKWRVTVVAGKPFLAHMASSTRWMVHYLNADMLDNESNRQQEALAMATFDEEFGARHAQALAAIGERLGLDYWSIDCSELEDGRLLVFEADNGMVVHDMDSESLFPYKKPQMRRVFEAFQRLLADRAIQGGSQSR